MEQKIGNKIQYKQISGRSEKRPQWTDKMRNYYIKKVQEEKDQGVIMQDSLQSEKHIDRILGNTCRLLWSTRAVFSPHEQEHDEKNYHYNYHT